MSKYQFNVCKFTIEKDGEFLAYLNVIDANRIIKELNNIHEEMEDMICEINHCHMIIDTLVEDARVNDYNDLLNKCDKDILKEMGWE